MLGPSDGRAPYDFAHKRPHFAEMTDPPRMTHVDSSRTIELQEAERHLREGVRLDPRRADAWHSLGMMALETGQLESAVDCLGRAAMLDDRQPVFLNHLGVAFARLEQYDKAIDCYRKACELDPQWPEAHYNWGNALRASGRLEEAVIQYRAALSIRVDSHRVYYNLANALRDLKRFEEAISNYQEAIRLQPDFVKAHTNLGNLYKDLDRLEEAVAVYREAIRLHPDYAQGYYNLGIALAMLRRFDEAEANFRAAIARKSSLAEAHRALARALIEQERLDEAMAVLQSAGDEANSREVWLHLAEKFRDQRRFDEAVSCLERLLCKAPGAEIHNNLGLVLMGQGQLEPAIANYRRALELKPDFAQAHSNLGIALELQGLFVEGMQHFHTALAIQPDFASAHLNRAVSWLRDGDFARGWHEFEWRWLLKDRPTRRPQSPQWLGQPMPGQTILLMAEQGLGDTIQFIRYAPLVKQHCGRVVVQCQKPLQRLLARCEGIDERVSPGQTLPEHDAQAPMMSLPRIFGTTLTSVPAAVPYLFADDALVDQWRQRLASVPGFRVGIAWQGNTKYVTDAIRSAPVRFFSPLARVPGVQLISLQKGNGVDQLADVADRVPVLQFDKLDEAVGAFMDTAAIMKNLDLVIASDTSIVHLAGAMGVPIWVALARSADWRWLEGREDSPWYPTMRLFRQTRLGDWEELFQRIAGELQALVEGDTSRLRPKTRGGETTFP